MTGFQKSFGQCSDHQCKNNRKRYSYKSLRTISMKWMRNKSINQYANSKEGFEENEHIYAWKFLDCKLLTKFKDSELSSNIN